MIKTYFDSCGHPPPKLACDYIFKRNEIVCSQNEIQGGTDNYCGDFCSLIIHRIKRLKLALISAVLHSFFKKQ